MSLKLAKKTAERIIAMVKSGDYDPNVIIHMTESLVISRDRRIEYLEKKNRPRVFNITEKKVAGALRDCIKVHGNITKEAISSAAKRIYYGCVELENTPKPIVSDAKPTIDIIHDKTTTHKLTVAQDGNIRIKIAKDCAKEEADYIIEAFTKVGERARVLGTGTLRGHTNKRRKKAEINTLTLCTDSKGECYNFNY